MNKTFLKEGVFILLRIAAVFFSCRKGSFRECRLSSRGKTGPKAPDKLEGDVSEMKAV